MNIYWILKMPTEFSIEIQYFNFDWKKIYKHTSLQSQKYSTVKVHDATATVGKTPPYAQNLEICRRKKVILRTP